MNVTQSVSTGTQTQAVTQSATLLTGAGPTISPPATQPATEAAMADSTTRNRAVSQTFEESDSVPKPFRPARHGHLSAVLGGVVVLALFIYLGARYVAYARSWVKTDNAYLAAHIHSVSSRIAGTVKDVLVEENQAVGAGAVLARLDPRDFEVRRQQAVAQVAQARAQFQDAEARIAQARAQIAHEKARAVKAKNDLSRASALYERGSGAISRQELDLARADADAAEAALQGAQSALESSTASASAAEASEQAARANLQDAELQLSYAEIVAPAAGWIGKKNLETGNRVQPGQTIAALVQTNVWVDANFKETQLAQLKPGQRAEVRLDAFPGRPLKGRVESLAPGSGAQFALLPPDNATGNFTKIVQRVGVRIVLEEAGLAEFDGRLIPGMSAVVEVRVK
jgi:membrane fusion protein (multidrug efflux system)